MKTRDPHHAQRLGAMLWAARIKCRNGAEVRAPIHDSMAEKIVENAKRYGIVMRPKRDGKFYL